MKTINVLDTQKQVDMNRSMEVYDEDYADEDFISLYEAAFLETFNKEQEQS